MKTIIHLVRQIRDWPTLSLKRDFPLLLTFNSFFIPLLAQANIDSNDGLALQQDQPTSAFELSWNGEGDRTYFIQYTGLLGAGWHYLPIIEQGSNETIVYGFWISEGADRAFFRLRYTDMPAADPYAAVFGGDGIPSGWKLENGLDPFMDYTGLSPDGSALTYWELYQMSLDGGSDPVDSNPAGLVVYSP